MSRLCEIRGFVSQSVQVSFACFFCCFYEVVISKLYNYQLYIYIYIMITITTPHRQNLAVRIA